MCVGPLICFPTRIILPFAKPRLSNPGQRTLSCGLRASIGKEATAMTRSAAAAVLRQATDIQAWSSFFSYLFLSSGSAFLTTGSRLTLVRVGLLRRSLGTARPRANLQTRRSGPCRLSIEGGQRGALVADTNNQHTCRFVALAFSLIK
jgi:hypothetical protein